MRSRRHHNTKGYRTILSGKTEKQVKRIAKKMGVKYGEPKHADPLGYSQKELMAIMSSVELSKFWKWICGQTCPVLANKETGYYSYDVDRFLAMVREGTPTVWD